MATFVRVTLVVAFAIVVFAVLAFLLKLVLVAAVVAAVALAIGFAVRSLRGGPRRLRYRRRFTLPPWVIALTARW
jgi:hypothetical protein